MMKIKKKFATFIFDILDILFGKQVVLSMTYSLFLVALKKMTYYFFSFSFRQLLLQDLTKFRVLNKRSSRRRHGLGSRFTTE